MLNTIMAARSIVFMIIFGGLARWLAEIDIIGLRRLLAKRPNENHMIIAFSVEHNSAIDSGGLLDPIALFILADQTGLLGR
jgi:hypothetical protein